MAKMSSSKRGPHPGRRAALKIMEAPLLRWLYARRKPNQSFKIAFDQEIQRLYDEWDSLVRKVEDGTVLPADAAAYSRAVRTAAGELPGTPRPLPYRTLASVADITAGAEDQTLRILTELDPENPLTSLDEARPRLDRAENWITTQVPPRPAPSSATSPTRSCWARSTTRAATRCASSWRGWTRTGPWTGSPRSSTACRRCWRGWSRTPSRRPS